MYTFQLTEFICSAHIFMSELDAITVLELSSYSKMILRRYHYQKLLRQHYYFLISMLQILVRIGINIKETPTIGMFVVGVSDAGTNWVITNL